MPRRGRRSLAEQSTFFVTTTVKDFNPVFGDNDKLQSLRLILKKVVQKYLGRVHGYVLMPSHFHLLIRLDGGGPMLSRLMKDIKSLSSRQILREASATWMHRFDDVAVYNEEQFRVKLAYIHNNPVRAGLVRNAEDYYYSSARFWLSGEDDDMLSIDDCRKVLSSGDA